MYRILTHIGWPHKILGFQQLASRGNSKEWCTQRRPGVQSLSWKYKSKPFTKPKQVKNPEIKAKMESSNIPKLRQQKKQQQTYSIPHNRKNLWPGIKLRCWGRNVVGLHNLWSYLVDPESWGVAWGHTLSHIWFTCVQCIYLYSSHIYVNTWSHIQCIYIYII